MIGLGTNRLSASRLAGLGEASQFRNGQWLEGVGSWASPYSAAATAALKAAFPQYWNEIMQYGFDHPEIVPYVNEWPAIGEYIALYGDSFANLVVDNNMSFETPRYAIDAQTVAERTWLIRSPANFTGWTDIDTLLAQTDWEYLPGGFSNNGNYVSLEGTRTSSNKTILKFFIPSQMPTGLAESYADNIWVYINGVQIWGKNGSWHNNKVTHDLDLSNIIRVGKVNYIESSWTGSGGNGIDIGLY